MSKPARLLIIAGSDSGGGAGIQADIKTATMLGAYAMTAITAVTVQNTQGVQAVHPIPPAIVRAQIISVLEDIGADAIKLGMLGSAAIVEAVAQTLAQYAPNIPIVLDPVMEAKGGATLLEDDAANALISHLFHQASLITPNTPEAARLTGRAVDTLDDCRKAGQTLLSSGAKAVLMKGGHLSGDVLTDLLITATGTESFASQRLYSRSTHGTGCTLASAIATGLAQGLSLSDAVRRARNYVHKAIETAPGFGHGHGPLNHMIRL